MVGLDTYMFLNSESSYRQTQISIGEYGFLNISQFFFQEHGLIDSECEAKVTKPEGYEKWRVKRKESFLAGRLAVRYAQYCLNLPMVDIPKGSNGSPIWPNNYTGSISHIDGQAVAVLLLNSHSHIKGIGIDVEKTSHSNQLEELDMIGRESELQVLTDINVEARLARLLLFSLKESVYKALFPIVGTFFDFLDVDLISCHKNTVTFQVKRQLSDQVQKGFQLKGNFIQEQDHLITWAYW